MKPINKFLSIFSVLSLLVMTFTTSALAFDGLEGGDVVIKADEVIEDDVYVGAANFTLEGTIKGDLIVAGTNITINGTVDGDLIAARRHELHVQADRRRRHIQVERRTAEGRLLAIGPHDDYGAHV